MANCRAVTINEMEDLLYDYISGVLPLVSEAGVYTTRFYGFALQKDPIHMDAIRRNLCYIKAETFKSLYTNAFHDTTDVYHECLFTYSILIQNKQTNTLLTDAVQQALRIASHRDGFEFFSVCGLKHLASRNFYVTTENNISVFNAELELQFTAAISVSDIKSNKDVTATGVELYNYDEPIIILEGGSAS